MKTWYFLMTVMSLTPMGEGRDPSDRWCYCQGMDGLVHQSLRSCPACAEIEDSRSKPKVHAVNDYLGIDACSFLNTYPCQLSRGDYKRMDAKNGEIPLLREVDWPSQDGVCHPYFQKAAPQELNDPAWAQGRSPGGRGRCSTPCTGFLENGL